MTDLEMNLSSYRPQYLSLYNVTMKQQLYFPPTEQSIIRILLLILSISDPSDILSITFNRIICLGSVGEGVASGCHI